MNIYHRNTNFRFILLWSIGLMLIIAGLLFLLNRTYFAALITIGLLVVCAFIKINQLLILENTVSIKSYSVFGFKKRELTISEGGLSSIKFWEHGSLDNTSSTDTFLDLFLIPALFLESKKGMTVNVSSSNDSKHTLRLYLSDKEHKMIKELMQQQNSKAYNISFLQ